MSQEKINEVFDAAFRIIGDDLDPNYISNLLEIKPDYSHKRGDRNNIKSPSGKVIIGKAHKTGIWALNSDLPETSTLEEHLLSLLVRLESVQDKVKQLTSQGYRVDFYCGHFLRHGYEGGFNISPEVLERIGKMGIILAISTNEL